MDTVYGTLNGLFETAEGAVQAGTVTTADEALSIALAAQRILRLMIAGRNRDAEFYSYLGEHTGDEELYLHVS